MRALSAGLISHLAANNVLSMGDLYEFTSPVLGVARITGWSANVTFGGNTYTTGVVIPKRERVRARLGLEVDQLQVEIGHGGAAVYGATSQTWAAAALSGALDGATVKLHRAFFAANGTLVDAVEDFFGGYVGEVEPKSTTVRLTVESSLARLRMQWPKVVIGAGCSWNLYDAGCGLTRPTTWDATTTLAAAAANQIKIATLTDQGFALGCVQITAPTSSPLYGLSRTIVSAAASGSDLVLTVAPAWPSTPGAGLTAKITKGCDKTANTCANTFSNLKHYAGAPMSPPESTRKS